MLVATGTLIAESLRCGASLDGMSLVVEKIARANVGDAHAGQPSTWTFIEFSVELDQLDHWVGLLSEALDDRNGWYCDLRSPDETFVVLLGGSSAIPVATWPVARKPPRTPAVSEYQRRRSTGLSDPVPRL